MTFIKIRNLKRKVLAVLLSLTLIINLLSPALLSARAFAQEASVGPEQAEQSTAPSDSAQASSESVAPIAEPAITQDSSSAEITPEISPVPAEESAVPSEEPVLIVEPTVEPELTPTQDPVTDSIINTEPVLDTEVTPVAEPSATPVPTPAPVWQDLGDKAYETSGNLEINKEYAAPQNDKLKITFITLPESSGKLTVKEIKLTAEQIAQMGALSDTAYDITSTMQDGTFEYDLTLPLPENTDSNDVEVKSAENVEELTSASEVSGPKEENSPDTITIKGLNHFTVFVVTAPSPDTTQRVLINEIVPTAGQEWVELFNNGTASVNLAAGTGWIIRNSANVSQSLSGLGTISAAGRAVFNAPAGFLSDVAPETVTILNELGATIDTVTVSLTGPGIAVDHYPLAGESVGRRTDGAGEWKVFASPTKNTANTTVLPIVGLAEVSSINSANGFPTWFKDQNGIALQLCLAGANGLADGICTLPSAGEEPNFNPANPVSFPTNFPGESFWYIAEPDVVTTAGQTGQGRVRFRYALEAAFTTEAPTVDQQIAFLRVNMQPIDDLVPGADYVVTHPFGSFTMTADPAGSATAGTAPNHRDEDGAFTPPLTEATAASILPATNTNISKFLRQVNPVPPQGYIGDGTLSTIESGPNGNFVRIEGPSIDVNNYDLDGNPNRLTISLWTVSGKLAGSTAPIITLFGANPVNATQNSTYTDAGATALDDADGNLTGNIVVTGLPVNTAILGAKTVTYTVSDSAGNTATATRTVNVVEAPDVDTTAPVITLNGTSPVSITAGTPYIDAGATALDNVDGDISANIVTVNPVNAAVIGTYAVTYNVSDSAGNPAVQITRTVNVGTDTVVPVITITGSNPVNVLTGATYTDAGATATDNVGGNLTASIVVTGLPINTTVVGVNTVTYTVTDAAGNTAVRTRTVNVANTLPAGLVETGPIAPAGGLKAGFPIWYKDSNGIALDLMEAAPADPKSISDPVDPANQFSQTLGFNAEGFWWSSEAFINRPIGTRALLVLAQEAAFAGEAAVDGEQSVQNRLRYRIDGLVPGETYTIIHPFGSIDEVADDAGVINVTDDIGCFAGGGVTCDQAASPNFSTALSGQVGPFLTWTTFNTNPALSDPLLTGIIGDVTRRYVGDPAIEHAVTGSPTGNNLFRVTGPNVGGPGVNSIETNLFLVSGRLADVTAPVITLNGVSPVEVAKDAVYTDAGATALDDFDGIVTVTVTGLPIDTSIVGAKTVTYTATDRSGNTATATRTVNVTGADTTAPVITLLGTTPVNILVGATYTDAGATALDNVDGNITANIATTGLPINTSVAGTFTVTYNVIDAALNAAVQVTRTVNVIVDTTAPVITLLGTTPVNILVGATYTDAGATALDNINGNITANIATVNPVNTAIAGTYTVTYNVSDATGNAAVQVIRTVNVIAVTPQTAAITISPAAPTLTGTATQTFTAPVVDAQGNPIVGATATFATSNPAVGTINSATGVFTPTGAGTATITATSGTATNTAIVTVQATATTATVSPATPTVGIGTNLQFAGSVNDQFGAAMLNPVIFSSTNPAVGLINAATGLFTPLSAGITVVTVTSGAITTTTTVTVTAAPQASALNSVNVRAPTAITSVGGANIHLIAVPVDQNGVAIAAGITTTFVSNNTAVATVNANGLVTPVSAGKATIRVTSANGTTTVKTDFNITVEISVDSASLASLVTNNIFQPAAGTVLGATTAITVASPVAINIAATGGKNHKVRIPQGTVITRIDGAVINVNSISATVPGTGDISGFVTGATVNGALQWGIPNIGLAFATPVTLDINVGAGFNGQALNVSRSTSGNAAWTTDGIVNPSCVVANGLCSFQITKASFFATYTLAQESVSSNSSSGSSGSGDGQSDGLGCGSHDCSGNILASAQVGASNPAQVFEQGFIGDVLGVGNADEQQPTSEEAQPVEEGILGVGDDAATTTVKSNNALAISITSILVLILAFAGYKFWRRFS